jgi:hypothetical protein
MSDIITTPKISLLAPVPPPAAVAAAAAAAPAEKPLIETDKLSLYYGQAKAL